MSGALVTSKLVAAAVLMLFSTCLCQAPSLPAERKDDRIFLWRQKGDYLRWLHDHRADVIKQDLCVLMKAAVNLANLSGPQGSNSEVATFIVDPEESYFDAVVPAEVEVSGAPRTVKIGVSVYYSPLRNKRDPREITLSLTVDQEPQRNRYSARAHSVYDSNWRSVTAPIVFGNTAWDFTFGCSSGRKALEFWDSFGRHKVQELK